MLLRLLSRHTCITGALIGVAFWFSQSAFGQDSPPVGPDGFPPWLWHFITEQGVGAMGLAWLGWKLSDMWNKGFKIEWTVSHALDKHTEKMLRAYAKARGIDLPADDD